MFERLARFFGYVLATSPIWYAPWFLFPAGFGKVPFFTVGVALAMVAAYVGSVRKEQAVGVSWRSPVGLLRMALLVNLVVAGASALLSGNASLGFWGSQSRQTGIVIFIHLTALAFLLPTVFRDRSHWIRFTEVVLWSASVPAVVALAESMFPSIGKMFAEEHRFSAWFGNPTFLAGYLSAAIFFGLRLLGAVRGWRRVCASVLLCLCAGGVLVTGSRGGFLGLAAGLGAAVLCAGVLYWRLMRQRKRAIVASAIGAGVLVISIIIVGGGQGPLSRVVNADVWLRENQPRFIGWHIAWKGFQARPILGWGTEQFQTVFDRYYDPQLLRYSFYETVSDKPHNVFLELLATQGALGILALLGVFAAAGWVIVVGVHSGNLRRADAVSSGALVVGLGVFSFFLFHLLPVLIIGYVSLAFLCAASNFASDGEPSTVRPLSVSERWVWLGMTGCCVISALVLAAWAGPASVYTSIALDARDPTQFLAATRRALAWGGPYVRENRMHLSYAFIRQQTAGLWPSAQAAEEAGLLIPSFESDGLTKQDFTSTFVLGQLDAIVAEVTQDAEKRTRAQTAFEYALELSPGRQVAAIQLARVSLMAGHAAEAISLLQALITAHPDVAEPYWYLGLAQTAGGLVADAAATFHTAIRMGRYPRNASEVEYVVGVLNAQQNWEDIIAVYQHVLSTELTKPAPWHAKLAATYAQAGRLELAVMEAQRAAQLDPSFAPEAHTFIETLQDAGNRP